MSRESTSKIVIGLYAGIAYAIFAVTFAYLLGFLLSFGVEKTINGGNVGPAWQAILVNAGLIALFGLQHSLMARGWFKRWMTKHIPPAVERSTYVLASSLVIAVMIDLWQPIPYVLWRFEHPFLQAATYGVMLFGWLLVAYASFLINHFELFGLRQAMLYLQNREYHPVILKSDTVYRIVRHPILLGTIIAIWATPIMTVGHMLFALGMTGYIVVGSRLEERDLATLHGTEYREYQRRVPMILPRLGLGRLTELLRHLRLLNRVFK